MRGKVNQIFRNRVCGGITPAYAGKSTLFQRVGTRRWDHPRLCGEKLHKRHFFHTCKGSPPPMRGKVCDSSGFSRITRITPAYAGKRPASILRRYENKDHPRLCGEKLLLYVPLPAGIGSPPPMRGKGSGLP